MLVTFTTIIQPPAGIVAPLAYWIVVVPAVAVTELRVHVPVSPLGVAITRFVGRVSTRLAVSAAALWFVLVSVKVRVVTPPLLPMPVAPKAFETDGGVLLGTVMTADAAVALFPTVVWSVPAAMVFV